MRERIGYSNFVDKYGKIIFPMMFLFLFLGFISPLAYQKFMFHSAKLALSYCYYVFLPAIITSTALFKSNYKYYERYYSSYQEYVNAQLTSTILIGVLSIIAIVILCCAIAFLINYFVKHKANKVLLITTPSLYLIMVVIACIESKSIPFVGFDTTLIFLIFAILYCANAQLLPKPRQHKLTKSERIAELEKQVAELTKEKDTH